MRLWGVSWQFCYNIQVSEALKPNHWHVEQVEGERKCQWIKPACCHHKQKTTQHWSYVEQRRESRARHAIWGTVSTQSGRRNLSGLISMAGKRCTMSGATLTCTKGAGNSGAWSFAGKFRVCAQTFPCLKAERDWLTVSYFLQIQRIGVIRNLTTYSGGPDAQLRWYCIQNGCVQAGLCNLHRRLVKAKLCRWGRVCVKVA